MELGPGKDDMNLITGINPDYQFPPRPPVDSVARCRAAAGYLAEQEGRIGLQQAKEEFRRRVQETHHTRCFAALSLKEAFSYRTVPGEYQYTLHYYDQAGNLVQTVPPEGVDPLSPTITLRTSREVPSRQPRAHAPEPVPVQQPRPGDAPADARCRRNRFWYNAVGQIRLSQTEQQQAEGRHAYVKYDGRGRIVGRPRWLRSRPASPHPSIPPSCKSTQTTRASPAQAS